MAKEGRFAHKIIGSEKLIRNRQMLLDRTIIHPKNTNFSASAV